MLSIQILIATVLLLSIAYAFTGWKAADFSLDGMWITDLKGKTPGSFRVGDGTITLDESDVYHVVLGERDNRIVVRIAGTDELLLAATIVDADRTDCYFPRTHATLSFIRIPEVSLETITGDWILEAINEAGNYQGEHTSIALGKDSFRIGNQPPKPISIKIIDNGFQLIDPEEKDIALIFTADKRGGFDGREEKDGVIRGRVHLRRADSQSRS